MIFSVTPSNAKTYFKKSVTKEDFKGNWKGKTQQKKKIKIRSWYMVPLLHGK